MVNCFFGDWFIYIVMCYGYLDVFKVLVNYGVDLILKNCFGDVVEDYLGDFELEEVL